jgi:hypothetical protein
MARGVSIIAGFKMTTMTFVLLLCISICRGLHFTLSPRTRLLPSQRGWSRRVGVLRYRRSRVVQKVEVCEVT